MGKTNESDALTGRSEGLPGLELGIELCTAILAVVGRDGFHGGVRPDNITLGGTNSILGAPLSHRPGEFSSQELEFMAPELFWNGQRTPAADVYSIGLALYVIYNNGRLPFWPPDGETSTSDRARALEKRMRGEDIVPPSGTTQEISEVIMRALAFRPEERWLDAEEFRNVLGECSMAANSSKEAAASASISLSNSPLDRPSGELSEIERMMAEIISQGQTKPADAPQPKPLPESKIRPEPIPVPLVWPSSAPEKKPKWRGRAFIIVFACVALLLILCYLLRGCVFPLSDTASAPVPTGTSVPEKVLPVIVGGTDAPSPFRSVSPSESPALPVIAAATATPTPTETPIPITTPVPTAAPAPTPAATKRPPRSNCSSGTAPGRKRSNSVSSRADIWLLSRIKRTSTQWQLWWSNPASAWPGWARSAWRTAPGSGFRARK